MTTCQKCFGLCAFVATHFSPPALAGDTLLIHGHIYTGDEKAPWAQALAITGTRIEAVGTDRQVLARRKANADVIDLQGRTVIPGISDSHAHMLFGAMALHGVNLSTPERSIAPDDPDALGQSIKAYAESHPNEKILYGRADFSTTPPSMPTHELLDAWVSDRPLVVHHVWEHALWLNAKALALAGIGDLPVADPEEEKGIVREASGHPTGVLLEGAMEVAERAVATLLSREEKLSLLREASAYLNRYGITSVVNATGSLEEVELYATLRDRGQLTVRTRTSFGAVAANHHLTPEWLADLDKARTLHHDDWVSADLVKFFADGGSGPVPPLTYVPAEYKKLVFELDQRGYQLMTHTLRSDTARLVLDAYEEAAGRNGPRDRRLRIEHGQFFTDLDLPRVAKLSVVVSAQPSFCCSDIGSNYDPRDKTPTDRWRSLLNDGVVLAFGSDWPCTWPPDPFLGIQQAVTRQIWGPATSNGFAGGAFDGAGQAGAVLTKDVYVPEERITVEEAVGAYTRGSAYARFADERIGTLMPGKEADLAVLSQDLFSVPADEIGRTKAVVTMVGGKVVFTEPK